MRHDQRGFKLMSDQRNRTVRPWLSVIGTLAVGVMMWALLTPASDLSVRTVIIASSVSVGLLLGIWTNTKRR